MNKQEVKKYLEKYGYIDVCIEVARFSINKDLELAKHYRGEPIKIKEDIIQNKKKIQRLESEKNRIRRSIEVLEPIQKEVLKLRYFENLNFCEIAEKMMYSYKYVSNLHSNALKTLAKIGLERVL